MFRWATFCFLLLTALSSQSQITFVELSLEEALSKASAENKMIFVDAYASYCLPCKQMDIEFKNPKLYKYFNENFINVKVNMERSISNAFKSEYQIVFLPSLIFIEPSGRQRTKIDNIVSSNELLSIGKYINNKYGPHNQHAIAFENKKETVVHPTPFGAFPPSQKVKPKKKQEIIQKEDEKILYVMGQENQDLPPDLLKQEAYFRMELMDGSHFLSAQKYLETQENWLSEENKKFIFDFIPDCKSPLFKHVVDHKVQYISTLGKDRVNKTIGILVNRELERGFPRPNKDRALFLYSLINTNNPQTLADQYILETQYLKKNYKAFFTKGLVLLESENIQDTQFIYKVSQASILAKSENKKNLKKITKYLEALKSSDPNNENYSYTLSQVHLKLNNKKQALANIQQASEIIKTKNISNPDITSLHERLSNLN